MKNNIPVVVFAGGGTGGHVYPGLAVAAELKKIAENNGVKIRICWIGNCSGMDRTLVQKDCSVDRFYGIPSGKLRRYFSINNFFDVFKILAGFVASFFILIRLHPAVLFSKGGFVSVPPCMSAHLLHIPVYTHECDFTPGLATRINSKFAEKILVSYEETSKYFSEPLRMKIIVTGNPVRPVFYSADSEKGKTFLGINNNESAEHTSVKKPILLVLGGSLGAHQINSLVAENLEWLCSRFNVIHQTGARDSSFVSSQNSFYHPYAFIYSEMPDVIAAADIVLSRAGANSLWECAALGKPLVLIPLCGSGTRGDQVDNAEFFAEKGAAIVLAGNDADSIHLRNALEKMENSSFREKTGSLCKSLALNSRPADVIASLVYEHISARPQKILTK